MLMWFDWGLYAVWHVGDRIQVSMDNRRETIYSAQTLDDHLRFYDGAYPGFPDRIAADYIWLPPTLEPVAELKRHGWNVLYQGPRSLILGHEARPPVAGSDDQANACFPNP
jgi:hypothetical protein